MGNDAHEKFLDELLPHGTENRKKGICPACKTEVKGFRDKISEREFAITGFCQKCQDELFDDE